MIVLKYVLSKGDSTQKSCADCADRFFVRLCKFDAGILGVCQGEFAKYGGKYASKMCTIFVG